MANIEEIKKFLIESNKQGYGSGEERARVKEADGSTTITYENGEWRFHDNYFGGEPYGGREVIFANGKPVWMMVYYGEISDKSLELGVVYDFLMKALLQAPDDLPVRGPAELRETIDGVEWVYLNSYTGDLSRFKGREVITRAGQEIYDADYSGGLVDETRGV